MPDGTLVAGCLDNVLVLDVRTRAVTATLGESKYRAITDLAVLPNGLLAASYIDSFIRLWDVGARTCVATLAGHKSDVQALAVLPGGLLASGGYDATVRLWDTASRACVGILTGHTDYITALATLPDGRLVSASNDGSVRV